MSACGTARVLFWVTYGKMANALRSVLHRLVVKAKQIILDVGRPGLFRVGEFQIVVHPVFAPH